MRTVIVSSSYSYLERVELLKAYYESVGYDTTVLLTDFIHSSKSYADWEREGYVLIPTKPYRKNISAARLYSHHKFAKAVAKYLEELDMDLLHVLLPANSLAKVAGAYKEKHPDTTLCLDVIDLWPETMPISKWKTAYPFVCWRKLRDDYLDVADRVYCECELFQRVLGRENDEHFRTLYWIKTEDAMMSKPKLHEDELHLCYLGSINNVIDIDYIVRMCECLSEQKRVILHIVGDGEKREELVERVCETKAEVRYHGLIYDPEKKQEIFDECQFGLNIMKSSVCVGLTMKSLDYFQAGLPIVNNIEGDTKDFIAEYGIGFHGYEVLVDQLPRLKMTDYLSMRENVKRLYQDKFTEEVFYNTLGKV